MIINRERAVRRIQRRLIKRGWPRLQVSLAFLIAALVAFTSSYALLRLGLSDMTGRYMIATTVAYVAFLLLLRFFVSAMRRGIEMDGSPWDALDLGVDGRSSSRRSGLGRSDGNLDPAISESIDPTPALSFPDLDDGLVILVPLLVLGTGIISAIYVVYVAPVLLAELILDVVVVSRLARRFDRIHPGRWYHGPLRLTYKPFLGVLAAVALGGFVAGLMAPDADSIGDFFRSG